MKLSHEELAYLAVCLPIAVAMVGFYGWVFTSEHRRRCRLPPNVIEAEDRERVSLTGFGS